MNRHVAVGLTVKNEDVYAVDGNALLNPPSNWLVELVQVLKWCIRSDPIELNGWTRSYVQCTTIGFTTATAGVNPSSTGGSIQILLLGKSLFHRRNVGGHHPFVGQCSFVRLTSMPEAVPPVAIRKFVDGDSVDTRKQSHLATDQSRSV